MVNSLYLMEKVKAEKDFREVLEIIMTRKVI